MTAWSDRDWPALDEGEILIGWLDLERVVTDEELEWLAPAEHARAARFAFDRDRQRFIAGRAAVRHALARQTGKAPKDLALHAGPHGKPYLADAGDLSFNLTHSGSTGLLAISRGAEIGVDLERVTLPADPHAIAGSVFTPEERRLLQSVPKAQLAQAFFTCWTLKEACLKAVGTGMSIDPREVHMGMGRYSGQDEAEVSIGTSTIAARTIVENENWIASLAVIGAMKSHRVVNPLHSTANILN
ncbi:MAG: 4'-phosphopantetheinyl transferase superfamily protein [Betaproteobacteria bacterium]|nr:4'-phosphopantetheinyl transferase superfamily protein [Betaproteobacteria bacterium]